MGRPGRVPLSLVFWRRALIGKLKQEQSPAVHGAPRIILTGGTWFGDVKILRQRMWERFLNRR